MNAQHQLNPLRPSAIVPSSPSHPASESMLIDERSKSLPSSASHPGSDSSMLIDGRFKSLLETEHHVGHGQMMVKSGTSFTQYPRAPIADWCGPGLVTIGMLADVPLLVIFDYYLHASGEMEAWRTLVHVCRKWRDLVFGSPYRLNVKLVCTARRPVREMLESMPPLPIVVSPYGLSGISTLATDNIIAALEHNDRIHRIELREVSSSLLDKALAVMQGPFPVLTDLDIRCDEDEIAPVVPDSFLGRFAPRLRKLSLEHIPFPGLPKLLLSACDLVEVSLWHIPHSGYISPSAMVDCLSTLSSLKSLWILFKASRSFPDLESRPPPSQTRFVFPSLTHFEFKGTCDYIEDFVARINAPLLDCLNIGFFHQPTFDTPQLVQFVSRTPRLEIQDEARVTFFNVGVEITFRSAVDRGLGMEISCKQQDEQLSSLAQVCSACVPRAFTLAVEHLYIGEGIDPRPSWLDNVVNTQWFEFLHTFIALKNLYLSQRIEPRMLPALQVEDLATEVLPALQSICLQLPSRDVRESVERALFTRGIVVYDWDGERCMWWTIKSNDVETGTEGEWWYGDTDLEDARIETAR